MSPARSGRPGRMLRWGRVPGGVIGGSLVALALRQDRPLPKRAQHVGMALIGVGTGAGRSRCWTSATA
jgi:hypothetical protein